MEELNKYKTALTKAASLDPQLRLLMRGELVDFALKSQ